MPFRPFSKLLFTISCLVLSAVAVAQPSVDLWSITAPTNPTNCTNTIITIAGQNDAANYVLDPITFTVTGTTITVNINYSSGFIILPAFMPWTHSVNLGSLAPGSYNIVANGSLNNGFNSSVTGFMTVIPCCPAIASFSVNNDTLCLGDTVEFNSTSTGPVASQSWLYGTSTISNATSGSQPLSQAGQQALSLIVTDGVCSDTSTQIIEVVDLPVTDLGNDTSICDGSVLTKSVPGGYASYAWSDGASGANGSISMVGDLSVTVTSSEGCVNSDTVSVVSLIPQLVVNLGADTALCSGASWVLDAGAGFDSYAWSSGETTQAITIDMAGDYVLEVSSAGSCSGLDTLSVDYFIPVPVQIGPGNDSCDSRELTAVSSGSTVLQWSTSETSNAIVVSTSGTYILEVVDSNGCNASDTALITIVPSPAVELGEDVWICPGDSVDYTASAAGNYLWSDGSTGAMARFAEGTHWLEVSDSNGCSGSDTVVVALDICGGIQGVEKLVLRVYPNPANDWLTFDLNEWTSIEVVDMTGRIIAIPSPTANGKLNVQQLKAGHYILKLNTDSATHVAHFLKQ